MIALRHAARGTLLLLLLVCVGCKQTGSPSGTPPVTALFQLPRGGEAEFYTLPWPNDIRLEADGSVDMSGFATPNTLVQKIVGLIDASVFGWGTTSGAFFRFDGEIDPATLPRDPAFSLANDATVYLVDIDPDSPDWGERIPVRVAFRTEANNFIGSNFLAVIPVPGFVLRQGRTYATIVTTGLRDSDRRPLLRDPEFSAMLSDQAHPDPITEAARARYEPLRAYLAAAEIDPPSILVAAVYTTQEIVGKMQVLREAVYRDLPDPDPVPADLAYARSGTGFHLYEGTFEGPNYQQGDPPYAAEGGEMAFGADGLPILQRTEPLRFAVSVPIGPMPAAGWPVVLYAHGTGGSYIGFANRVAGNLARIYRAGEVVAQVAVIGIDQVLHGTRCDATNCDPETNFFNVQNPLAARDNALQGASDNFQLKRLVQTMNVTSAPETGQSFRFDPDRIMFMGHSQGGLTGPPFLAVEPEITLAILSGAAGNLSITLLSKTEPVDITSLVELLLNETVELDEFHPVFSLLQMFLEPADAVNYGRYFIDEPLPGNPPKHIYVSQGWLDTFSPSLGIEAFGLSIGLTPVAPQIEPLLFMPFAGITEMSPRPIEGNLRGGTITGVFAQYESWSDGHFVVFDNPIANTDYRQFIGSYIADGIPALYPLPDF